MFQRAHPVVPLVPLRPLPPIFARSSFIPIPNGHPPLPTIQGMVLASISTTAVMTSSTSSNRFLASSPEFSRRRKREHTEREIEELEDTCAPESFPPLHESFEEFTDDILLDPPLEDEPFAMSWEAAEKPDPSEGDIFVLTPGTLKVFPTLFCPPGLSLFPYI